MRPPTQRIDEPLVPVRGLFQRGWVLLTESGTWSAAAKIAAERTGVAVDCRRIQPEPPVEFRRAYGLSRQGAALVRPDGYLAWRCRNLPTDPAEALTRALSQVSQPNSSFSNGIVGARGSR